MNVGLIPLSGSYAVRSNTNISSARDANCGCQTNINTGNTGFTASNPQLDSAGAGNSPANMNQLMNMMMSMMMMMMQMVMKMRGGKGTVPPTTNPNNPTQPGNNPLVLGDAPKPVIDPAKIDYNKDADLKQRQQDLLGGRNSELDKLMGIVDDNGPTSSKTKEALAKINKLWTDAKGDASALKEYNALQSLRENNSSAAALKKQVDEATDTAEEATAKLEKSRETHDTLIEQIKTARGEKPSTGNPGSNLPVAVDFDKDASLKARQHQLLKGKSTEIDKLLETIDNTNPESPEGEAAEKKLTEVWQQGNGDPKVMSEYSTLQNIRQSNSLLGSLSIIKKDLDPTSEEYKGIEARMSKITETKDAEIKKAKEFLGS